MQKREYFKSTKENQSFQYFFTGDQSQIFGEQRIEIQTIPIY